MQVTDWEEEDQLVQPGQFRKYIGEWRGIQGHLNSCYLDATIFGLFVFNDVFDSLFLENVNLGLYPVSESPAQQVQREIGSMLWKGIVNPLRKLVFLLDTWLCLIPHDYFMSYDCFTIRNGAVSYESVLRLKNKLDELGKMEGVNTAEKGQSLTSTAV